MSVLGPTTRVLAELMAEAPRGPRRDGLFALWLTVRVVEDLPATPTAPGRAERRRVVLLRKRLSSLSLSPALRRGLTAAITTLEEAALPSRSALLGQLAAVGRESLGAEAGDALARAAGGGRRRPET